MENNCKDSENHKNEERQGVIEKGKKEKDKPMDSKEQKTRNNKPQESLLVANKHLCSTDNLFNCHIIP